MSGMHLLPVYYTTTNTRKRKEKKKTKSLLAAEKEHEKILHRIGVGISKQKPKGGRSSVGRASGLQPEGHGFDPLPLHQNNARVAQSVEQRFCKPKVVGSIPSSGTTKWESCVKKPEKVYTGTEIIGIGQMHKSNAVPIRRKEDAKSLANMRR